MAMLPGHRAAARAARAEEEQQEQQEEEEAAERGMGPTVGRAGEVTTIGLPSAAPASSSAPFDRRSSCSSKPNSRRASFEDAESDESVGNGRGCAPRGSAASTRPSCGSAERRVRTAAGTPAACRRQGLRVAVEEVEVEDGGGGGGGGEGGGAGGGGGGGGFGATCESNSSDEIPRNPNEGGGGPGLGGPGGLGGPVSPAAAVQLRALSKGSSPFHTRPGQPGQRRGNSDRGGSRDGSPGEGVLRRISNGSDAPAAGDGAALRAAAPSMLARGSAPARCARPLQHVREGARSGSTGGRARPTPQGRTPVQAVPAARRTAAAPTGRLPSPAPGRRLAVGTPLSERRSTRLSRDSHLQTGLGAGVPTAAAGLRSEVMRETAAFADWIIGLHEVAVQRKIGAGSAGTTYAAEWRGAQVAVKVAGYTGASMEGWRAEVDALTRLRHPNIVQYLGCVVSPPTYCLVLEFCDAGDLYRALRFPTPPGLFVRVSRAVGSGMAYLHRRQIMHRDLKSSNVLLTTAGGVKLTDFGVAVQVAANAERNSKGGGGGGGGSSSRDGSSTDLLTYEHSCDPLTTETGTYRWMAPEVTRHEGYTKSADVFSYAMLLFELITHEVPFADRPPLQAAVAIGLQDLRPPLPTGVPPSRSSCAPAGRAAPPRVQSLTRSSTLSTTHT